MASLRAGLKQVRPVLSRNKEDARRRVLKLYKSWYRQIPFVLLEYDVDKTAEDFKHKLREEFERNKHINDVRVIDQLVIKGQMELREVAEHWKTKGHLMFYFRDTVPKKPTDFMSKFLAGHE